MISCIIIDDEQYCVDVLTAMLRAKFAALITVAATTTDSRKAAALIAQHRPQLVFMDVEMPHINGIRLMEALEQRDFAVIFTTAHEKYALQAIKTEAVDYLLKPISLDELREAVTKATHRLQQLAPAAAGTPVAVPGKLLLPASDGDLMVSVMDVIRIAADGEGSRWIIAGKPALRVSKRLQAYEDLLGHADFFRMHEGHLVNLHHVEQVHAGPGPYIVLTNGEIMEVPPQRHAALLQRLAAL